MRLIIFIFISLFFVNINGSSSVRNSKINLWGTYYYTPQFNSILNGIPLRDVSGNAVSKSLNLKDWCSCAMEGSCSVDGELFNFVKTTRSHYVDCSPFYRHRPSGFAKFKKINAKYGLGVDNIPLIPFKSIAVDKRVIPINSKVFIPEAKGIFYEFEGKILEHDGFFYAHDTGGLIKNNHIDFFIGLVEDNASLKNPFKFIKSNPKYTFLALVPSK